MNKDLCHQDLFDEANLARIRAAKVPLWKWWLLPLLHPTKYRQAEYKQVINGKTVDKFKYLEDITHDNL